MRRPFLILLLMALGGGASCVSPLHQYLAFGRAPVWPAAIPGEVGDVVAFQIRPEVATGSVWSLECRGRVRFADSPETSSLDWTASPHAVRLETIISPWDPLPPNVHTSRDWLSYGMREEGESSVLDRELPIHRVAYREMGPVTVASTFAPSTEKPGVSVSEQGNRVIVHYRTETHPGVARQPAVDAMLLESGNRTILYAEVRMNFGNVPKESIGYDVALSYDKARVSAPAEIIVAAWHGDGDYWKPFTVVRRGGSAGSSIPEIPKPTPPKNDAPAPKAEKPAS
jgi:hypothetical protein